MPTTKEKLDQVSKLIQDLELLKIALQNDQATEKQLESIQGVDRTQLEANLRGKLNASEHAGIGIQAGGGPA